MLYLEKNSVIIWKLQGVQKVRGHLENAHFLRVRSLRSILNYMRFKRLPLD